MVAGPRRWSKAVLRRLVADLGLPLQVRSGHFSWQLADVTLANPQLAGDGRSAAAEFDLAPLLADLHQDRPLRLALPGVFVELPVPPFVVAQWRSLPLAAAQPTGAFGNPT